MEDDNNKKDAIDLSTYLEFAKSFAKKSGKRTLQKWNSVVVISSKDAGVDIATNFDSEIEKEFSMKTSKRFPNTGFLGEEHPELSREGRYTWLIDPIDGTKWFAKGIPLWSVVISLVDTHNSQKYRDWEAVLSVVYNPTSDQLYSAGYQQGAWLNDTKLEIGDSNVDISKSIVLKDYAVKDKMITHISKNTNWESLDSLIVQGLANLQKDAYRVRDIGAGPLGMCWLAQKALDGYIIPISKKSKVVDHLGACLLAKEAGAHTKIHWLNDHYYQIVVANSKELATSLLGHFVLDDYFAW